MAGRSYYAWIKDDKFYTSFFRRPPSDDIKRPALEFSTREALEAEVAKRGGTVKWEDDS